MQLYGFQERAVGEVYKAFTNGARAVVLVAPTGAGKTVLASRIIHDAVIKRRRRAMFLAHRRELLHQASDKLTRWEIPHGMISGDMTGMHHDPAAPVQVASIQALDEGDVGLPSLGADDLIVVDECHRAISLGVRKLYPHTRVLGLTASPVRLHGTLMRSLHGEFDAMVIAATPSELAVPVTQGGPGVIVPPRIMAPRIPDLSALEDGRGAEFATKALSDIMTSPTVLRGMADDIRAMPRAKTVIFGVDIAHCRAMVDAGVVGKVITGNMRAAVRADILTQFEAGEIHTLLNADLLIEGWDCPSLQRVILGRPTKSLALFLQQVGRGVRAHPGKTSFELWDYAANIPRFGHPFATQPWSLDANKIKKCGERAASIWRCKACFSVTMGNPGKTCPYCGAEVSNQAMRIKVQDGQVIEYDEAELLRLEEARRLLEEQEAGNKEIRGKVRKFLFASAKSRFPHLSFAVLAPKVMREVGRFNASGLTYSDIREFERRIKW